MLTWQPRGRPHGGYFLFSLFFSLFISISFSISLSFPQTYPRLTHRSPSSQPPRSFLAATRDVVPPWWLYCKPRWLPPPYSRSRAKHDSSCSNLENQVEILRSGTEKIVLVP
ncbi:unnamed protein product [Cuscuta epithymum]|uniref:Secreted protein n=1 Tax=Cuscuta epithymum TaxID=186058 RepID=A0AAV0DLZ9_9ASTE|nr:unnamed protein product [Cuscuta epithymum]CAH9134249.1 unnamed protein product [Cuscuta epithymum]